MPTRVIKFMFLSGVTLMKKATVTVKAVPATEMRDKERHYLTPSKRASTIAERMSDSAMSTTERKHDVGNQRELSNS